MKYCPTCQTSKEEIYFAKHRNRFDGLQHACKSCSSIYQKERAKNNPNERKNIKLRHLYGINLEEYEELLLKQNGVCAICKKREVSEKKLAVDHNHKNGKIRGLLCQKCNTAIGAFEDNVELIFSAIEYLKKYDNDNHNAE